MNRQYDIYFWGGDRLLSGRDPVDARLLNFFKRFTRCIVNRCIVFLKVMRKQSESAKGNLAGLILAVLEDEPRHGYGIAREIEKRSADALSFGEGALYPALKLLEKSEFVLGQWDTSGTGPARRVYHLTPEGAAELTRRRVAWHEYAKSIDQVLGGVPNVQSA